MSPPLIHTLHEWMRVIMRHSMRNFILYTKEHKYSAAQLNTLLRIHRNGACSVSDLGEEMGVTSAAASQLLERLVQQGLAARSEDLRDRRNKVVTLTSAGRQIVQESIVVRQSWLDRLAELLTPEEQEQVNVALQLLIEKTVRLDEEEGPGRKS
ncbi:MAG: MarR family transcriptional regulator [Chloroflexi bacterium]|nr:MarR family transcriptional regulator [Chloroflexota bacterium]